MSAEPKTLLDALRHFADLDVATEFVAKLRWLDGPRCPDCGFGEFSYLTTRRLWKCKNKTCRKQYSVKQGTIFEDSPIGLDKWLAAIWMVANCRNGISSHELGRSIGVTQKSAWFMLHRIRLAMQSGPFEKLGGEVEVDETVIGGQPRNVHKGERARKITGTVGKDKTIVLGVHKRGGEIRATVIPDTRRSTLHAQVQRNVTPGAALYLDALKSDSGLSRAFEHETADHAECYVDRRVHTKGLENFWSLLKRGLHGTYISVQPYHLFRYLDEQVYRYNRRGQSDSARFCGAVGTVAGRA